MNFIQSIMFSVIFAVFTWIPAFVVGKFIKSKYLLAQAIGIILFMAFAFVLMYMEGLL